MKNKMLLACGYRTFEISLKENRLCYTRGSKGPDSALAKIDGGNKAETGKENKDADAKKNVDEKAQKLLAAASKVLSNPYNENHDKVFGSSPGSRYDKAMNYIEGIAKNLPDDVWQKLQAQLDVQVLQKSIAANRGDSHKVEDDMQHFQNRLLDSMGLSALQKPLYAIAWIDVSKFDYDEAIQRFAAVTDSVRKISDPAVKKAVQESGIIGNTNGLLTSHKNDSDALANILWKFSDQLVSICVKTKFGLKTQKPVESEKEPLLGNKGVHGPGGGGGRLDKKEKMELTDEQRLARSKRYIEGRQDKGEIRALLNELNFGGVQSINLDGDAKTMVAAIKAVQQELLNNDQDIGAKTPDGIIGEKTVISLLSRKKKYAEEAVKQTSDQKAALTAKRESYKPKIDADNILAIKSAFSYNGISFKPGDNPVELIVRKRDILLRPMGGKDVIIPKTDFYNNFVGSLTNADESSKEDYIAMRYINSANKIPGGDLEGKTPAEIASAWNNGGNPWGEGTAVASAR